MLLVAAITLIDFRPVIISLLAPVNAGLCIVIVVIIHVHYEFCTVTVVRVERRAFSRVILNLCI